MRLPATRLRILMCLALLGVLLLVGLVVGAIAGTVGVAVFVVLAGALVVLGIVRGRVALAPTPLPLGRTCTCCSTSQHDPVRIV
ncbi:MAG: hypothetical protein H7323_07920 [Frankiales bacterium]|nr:hypothetical protein [Frankiales bacterium]